MIVCQDITTDGFEFISNDERVLDRAVTFTLNSYATLTAIEMQFVTGDTYKFDLEVYNDEDDPFVIIAVREPLGFNWMCCDTQIDHLNGSGLVLCVWN